MTRHAWTCALLCALSGAAAADAPVGRVFDEGWYAAPMASVLRADAARCTDDGLGGALALGHRGDFAALELWAQYLPLAHDCSYKEPGPATLDPDDDERRDVREVGETVLAGGGLALLVGAPFDGSVLSRFYGVIGFGVNRRQDHPKYPEDDTTIFGDAGIGFLQPFELFGLPTGVRAELRYRYDVQQPPHPEEPDPPPEHAFGDVVFNVGMQFALSPAPRTMAPASEPVTVVQPADTESGAEAGAEPSDREPQD